MVMRTRESPRGPICRGSICRPTSSAPTIKAGVKPAFLINLALKAKQDQISKIQYLDYEFPFENLALEGGGVKGLVYAGAMQVM